MKIVFDSMDLRRLAETLYVLDQVTDAAGVQNTGLPALGRMVGCDVGVLTVFESTEPSETALLWPGGQFGVNDFDGYAELLDMHPFVAARNVFASTAALRITDLCSQREWKNTGLYRDHHRRLGADDQLACQIRVVQDRLVAIVMSRHGSPFDPRDRDLFIASRPHIARMVRRALTSTKPYRALHVGRVVRWTAPPPLVLEDPSHLSPRETQVLELLAEGGTSGRIARSLGVSSRTVEKHVQNIHRKLGVSSSLEAVSRWRVNQLSDA